MPLAGTAVLQGLEGVAQIVTSAQKLKKDKEELSKLKRPFYKIQDEYLQNKNIAATSAQGGLPSATKDYLTSETQRSQSSSISALLQSGGNSSDISRVFDIASSSFRKTAADDAQTHLRNIEYFMGVNKDLAGQKNIQFGVNELQPYEEHLKEITERRAADETNLWGGINSIIGAGTAYATGKSNDDLNKSKASLYNKLFADGNGNVSDPFDPSISSDNKLLKYKGTYNGPIDPSAPDITKRMTNLDDYWMGEEDISGKE